MTVMPLSEVKARLSEIADDVHRTHDRVHVTRNGRDYVVLLSADDFESLEATLELLQDDAAMARIKQAKDDIARGNVFTVEEVQPLIEARRRAHPESSSH
ncbi:MAG: type II toxin-antitoxin system Phd/YefM family antitoxin [Actinomycetales bacterium]